MQNDTFSMLLGLEQQAKQLATSFPRVKEPDVIFTGVGFGIGSYLMVVSVEDVWEVIRYPRVTPIPNVSNWLHGIAAIRGELFPIVHLCSAVGGPSSGHKRKASILVVRYLESLVGLLVDEVFGSKRFMRGERKDSCQEKVKWLTPYLKGAFVQKNTVWNIFCVLSLQKSGALSRL